MEDLIDILAALIGGILGGMITGGLWLAAHWWNDR